MTHLLARSLPMLLAATSLWAQSQTIGTWSAISTATTPSAREDAQLVFDPVRGRTFLAGGVAPGQSAQLSEFWEFDGSDWTRLNPTNPIQLRSYPTCFVFSPLRGRILALSSEQSYGSTPMRLYEWNGTSFVTLPGTPPPIRANDFEIAWDAARGVLVMFGGGPYYSDTWEWDGTSWAQRGTGGPSGRREHSMAYDAVRQRVVLWGGVPLPSSTRLTDTWEWDGSVWRERFGLTPPDLQAPDVAATFDTSRSRFVLCGGQSGSGAYTNAVWEFEGTAWTRLPTSGGPATISKAALAYDAASQRLLSFGGVAQSVWLGLYEMRVRNAFTAVYAQHGAGCAGASGTPSLSPRAGSRPVLGAPFLLRFANLPPSPLSPVFACVGFDDQSWGGTPLPFDATAIGLTGCSLRIAPPIIDQLPNQGGTADWDIPIPITTALDGSVFFVQGVVLANGANPGGALLSDSGRGVIGSL